MAAEREQTEPLTTISFKISNRDLEDVEYFKALIESPNIGSALLSAVGLILDLYQYEDEGFKLVAEKEWSSLLLKLPRRRRFRD